ncbi:MAG: alpha/beta hydrolase family protein [Lentisphaerae bacterium]|nr:alpha/beta hydrolase family protein [Lentisphaerota bacterium]
MDKKFNKVFCSERMDARYVCTRGFVHQLMRELQRDRPKLAFDPGFSREAFLDWQVRLRDKLRELMCFPEVPQQPLPKLISRESRTGFQLEKWECYPHPAGVVPLLMLVPDGVSEARPAPAVLCFPGSKGTKEILAGEADSPTGRHLGKHDMARAYARAGMIGVAVDNPGFGETADIGYAAGTRELLSLYLLEMGWHYWGMAVFNAMCIIAWLRSLAFVDSARIALSGHSAGIGVMVPLAVLDQDIRAIVNNDNLSDSLTRKIATTRPDQAGVRPYPSNPIRNLIPGIAKWFGSIDMRAALAPRHALYTEGGNQADLDMVKQAYRIMHAEDHMVCHHHPCYRDSENRRYDHVQVPEGLSTQEYPLYSNADGTNHFFHADLAVPWMRQVFCK